eukprot:m.28303 g.28303  ORF g.28303 m.28303 type:complete len:83 (+) comp9036_c0_seq1:1839-2087(+)
MDMIAGAFVLYDFVNFDELLPSLYQFSSSLAPDSVHDQYARAVLLDCLGCWIPIQYPLEQRDFLYQYVFVDENVGCVVFACP